MATIYRRGKTGFYWIKYSEGGEIKQYSLKTKDKKVASFMKNETENRLAKGDSPLPNFGVSPLHVLNQYRDFCKNRNKARTVSDDVNRIKMFLEFSTPARIKDITEDRVKAYLDDRLSRNEINLSTANHAITNLKTFLNFAVQKNYISVNPISRMKKYKVDRLPPHFLQKSEIRKVLDAAKDEEIYPMVATAIYTGMRYGEIVLLTWGDIDFQRNEIMVQKSKTSRFRLIPLHADLEKILAPIAGSKADKCFKLTNVRRVFWRVCTKSGNYEKVKLGFKRWRLVPTIGWHTFRHSYASHLIMSGVDLVTVSKLLGHASITTTMIYAHLAQEHIKDSVKTLQF